MNKQKHTTHSAVYLVGFAMALTLAIQILTAVDGSSTTARIRPPSANVDLTDVIRSRGEASRLRRLRHSALDRCGRAGQRDCPEDVNREVILKKFLRNAAPADIDTSMALRREDLSPRHQNMLERYERTRSCPPRLRSSVPGLYELCLSLIIDVENHSIRKSMTALERAEVRKAARRR